MTINLLSMESLNKFYKFRFQNDSFKQWCQDHQGEDLAVVKSYPDGTLRLKGYNFVISTEYTNYVYRLAKQVRDYCGGGGIYDCIKAVRWGNYDFDKAVEEYRNMGPLPRL